MTEPDPIDDSDDLLAADESAPPVPGDVAVFVESLDDAYLDFIPTDAGGRA